MELEKGDIVKLNKKKTEYSKDGIKNVFDYGVINNVINDVCDIIVFNQDGKILLNRNKGVMIPLRIAINKNYLTLCLKYNEPYDNIRTSDDKISIIRN